MLKEYLTRIANAIRGKICPPNLFNHNMGIKLILDISGYGRTSTGFYMITKTSSFDRSHMLFDLGLVNDYCGKTLTLSCKRNIAEKTVYADLLLTKDFSALYTVEQRSLVLDGENGYFTVSFPATPTQNDTHLCLRLYASKLPEGTRVEFNDIMLTESDGPVSYRPYGENEKINAQDFPDKVNEVYSLGKEVGEDIGKKSQYDEFWDDLQRNGTQMNWSYAFSNKDMWTQENMEKVKYKTLYGNYFSVVFIQNTSITDLSMFSFKGGLTPYGEIAPYVFSNTFAGCTNLVKCMPINCDMVSYFTSAFNGCTALEELILSGKLGRSGLDLKWSKKLSKESIESVINVLSTTASGQNVILSQTAVDKAFETSEGANDGSTSAEWEALANTKMNWTITLTEVQ